MSFFERIAASFGAGVLDAVTAVSRGAALHLPGLVGALIVLLAAWVTGRVTFAAMRRVLGRRSTEGHVNVVVARFARGAVWAVGIVTALAVLGIDVGALVTSLGLAGLTLGFALRDVLANSVAGVSLLLQRPFRIGDTISVSGTEGVVVDVRVRDTVLRTSDGRIAYVPNTTVFNGIVLNISAQPVRRFEIALWTPSAGDVEAARLSVLSAVSGVAGLLPEPAPEAQVVTVGPDRARIVARGWVDTTETPLGDAQSAALAAAHAALTAAGLEGSADAGGTPDAPAAESAPSPGE